MSNIQFPSKASSEVDWNRLGLRGFDQASHVEVHYSAETGVWGQPKVVDSPYLQIHGLAPGLNYGQQCYEGLKACRTEDNRILIFRADKHAARMVHSAEAVSIPPVPEPLFLACVNLAVGAQTQFVPPHDSKTLLYIRPVLFGSGAQLALTSPKEFTLAVFIQPGSAYHGVTGQDALVCEDFDRCAPKGVGAAKVGGNYAPVMKYSDKAYREGFALLLHLDSLTHTEIDEFSSSGFIGVKKGHEGTYTLVVPASHNILPSITTETCIDMALSWGWKVEKRTVKFDELYFFDEVLAVGTATLILPIRSITRRGTGEKIVYLEDPPNAGPCCEALRKGIDDILRGRVEGPKGWCYSVVNPTEKDTHSAMNKESAGAEVPLIEAVST